MAERKAEEIMNKKVITITKDKSIMELSELFLKNEISGVPVVDKENKLEAIVSESDIISFIRDHRVFLPMWVSSIYDYAYLEPDLYAKGYEENKEALANTKVEKIMHSWVKKAKKETLESEIANIMDENRINRVPIVDNKNKVIGIITRSDLIRSMIKKDII